jgi:hypothetical protein
LSAIDAVVKSALAGERTFRIDVSPARTRRIFEAASPHIEMRGGKADARGLCWRFPNGSLIKLTADSG